MRRICCFRWNYGLACCFYSEDDSDLGQAHCFSRVNRSYGETEGYYREYAIRGAMPGD